LVVVSVVESIMMMSMVANAPRLREDDGFSPLHPESM